MVNFGAGAQLAIFIWCLKISFKFASLYQDFCSKIVSSGHSAMKIGLAPFTGYIFGVTPTRRGKA
jgi:hypothetical protein